MISAIPPVPKTMGVPRIIPGRAVTTVLGDPMLSPQQDHALRRGIVELALRALGTRVMGSTVF